MDSPLEPFRQDMRNVQERIVKYEQKLAAAEQAGNKEEEKLLLDLLRSLQEKENILLRSQAPRDPDDVLHQVLNTMDELKALLPSLMMMSNPFQSASSLSSKQAEAQASDFKARLLQYYFTLPHPPGLLLPQAQAHLTFQCMVSKLCLSSNLIEAAHIVPKASAQWGACALGLTDIWDERNGLLWAEPFEKAYHANEIVVMYQPSRGTFRLRVLTEVLMCKRLSEYGKSQQARQCLELQNHTFGEYDETDLLMLSGNMPFRRGLAAHAAMAVAAQRHNMRSSLSFRAKDFDVVSDYNEKGTTAAWVPSFTHLTSGTTPQLAQGNPGYAVLASLEPNVAAELKKQLYKGQDGYYVEQPVNMLLEKFHFDREVNCTSATMEHRALAFDEICASSFKKERFVRMYHELNNSGANLAEINLPGNKYLGMWEKLPATVGAMHQLCALLEVSSSQDLEAKIPAARLVAKAGQLAPVITDLQTLCNKAGAKEVHGGSEGKVFKTAVSQILTAFSNTKLTPLTLAPLTRGQARRSNKRSDNYIYAITINEVEIEGYKKPDPFTQAVIKLLKPQAPAASDL
ncbi:TPA: hypothetical protein ACH3X1_003424 [Trebouxia sp. C0004]